jgi:hypothetical protein
VEDAEWRKEKFDSATQDLLKKENIDRQQEQENIKGHDKKVHNQNSNGGHKDFASKDVSHDKSLGRIQPGKMSRDNQRRF